MLNKYLLVILFTATPVLQGMLDLDSIEQFCREITEEEQAQQEQQEYNEFLTHVQKQIDAKQDLNLPAKSACDKTPPLLKACLQGDKYLPITQLLLNHGADPNVTLCGDTPLHTALFMLGVETIKLLLEKGANPNHEHPLWGDPLHEICDSTNGAWHKAVNRTKIAQLLLKSGAHTNNIFNGTTCLHKLIAKPYSHFTHTNSLNYSSDKQKKIFFGQRKELIKLALKFGGSLEILNKYGKNPIKEADEQCSIDPENKHIYKELANYAVRVSHCLRKQLLRWCKNLPAYA